MKRSLLKKSKIKKIINNKWINRNNSILRKVLKKIKNIKMPLRQKRSLLRIN